MDREQVIKEVADWIDRQVIAEMIVEHLEENDYAVTLEEAQRVWLGTLQNLGGGVGLAV
jgi:hypothetical protein